MSRMYILYNPLSNSGKGKQEVEQKMKELAGDKTFVDIRSIENMEEFFDSVDMQDQIVVSGGDGTLHHFINDASPKVLEHTVFFYPSGSGNDFCNDIEYEKSQGLLKLNPYLTHLPEVEIHGMRHRFLNNVAAGIDGYVCEKADEQRKKGVRKINYTTIALKGLLREYQPCRVTVYLDEEVLEFEHVWMAPTMKGRFVGGGMMITPMQNRMDEQGSLTLAVVHEKNRWKLLSIFPKIFRGGHTKYTKVISFYQVKHVRVAFEHPVSVQMDGETFLNVKEYEVWA